MSGICDNVSDITVVYGSVKIFLGVIDEALLIVGVFYPALTCIGETVVIQQNAE